ncbi:MAG TPA: hypothetical protein DCG57_10240 [Candidatus Riflebacteria bacterium]|jgi:type II secretory pathway component PulJ|nr:hypothetical protein [Candidatus Riflebacteria bacterium]
MPAKYSKRQGFTLVEMLVAFSLAVAVIIMALKLSSTVRTNVVAGTVDLQNLQQARAAINSIRRDFLVAHPSIDYSEGTDIREEIRSKPIISASHFSARQKSRPVIIAENEIHLFKSTLDENGRKKVEEISYIFDSAEKSLFRVSGDVKKQFSGIENVKFVLYQHQLNKKIPLVWVSLMVTHQEGGESRQLEIATTIVSSIIDHDLNNRHWNWNSN